MKHIKLISTLVISLFLYACEDPVTTSSANSGNQTSSQSSNDQSSSASNTPTITADPPPHSQVAFESEYASELTIEVWTGRSVSYKNGKVSGYNLKQRLQRFNLAPYSSTSIDFNSNEQWLVIIGITEGSNIYYLNKKNIENIVAGSVIKISSQGIIEHQSSSSATKWYPDENKVKVWQVENGITTASQVFDLSAIDDLKNAIKSLSDASQNLINLFNKNYLYQILKNIIDNSSTIDSNALNNWSFDTSTGEYLYNSSNGLVSIKSRYIWGDTISNISDTEKGKAIKDSILQQNNFFTNLAATITSSSLQLDFSSAGSLSALLAVAPNSSSASLSFSTLDSLINWFDQVIKNLNSTQQEITIHNQYTQSGRTLNAYLAYQGAINIKLLTKISQNSGISLDYGILPIYVTLDKNQTNKLIGGSLNSYTGNATTNGTAGNYDVSLDNWQTIIYPDTGIIEQTVIFTAKDNNQNGFKGRLYFKSSDTEVKVLLTDLYGNKI